MLLINVEMRLREPGLELPEVAKSVTKHVPTSSSWISRGPGSGLLELAQKGLGQFEIRSIALPYLGDLQKKTKEAVHLAILDSGEVMCLEKRESTQTIRMYSATEEKGLKAYTANTITWLSEFERECERIRARGFAFDLGEHEEEIRCVAAPILDHTGYPIAALSVAIPAFRANQDELRKIGFEVIAAAYEVSLRLGCTGRSQICKGSNGSESL